MNVLFITPAPYLPNRLHRIRAFELIKILAKKHTVHFVGSTTEDSLPSEFHEIRKICASSTIIRQSKLLSLLKCIVFFWLPAEVAYCRSSRMKLKIATIMKKNKIDLIYLKRLRSTIYLSPSETIPTIIDSTDAMSLFYDRMAKKSSGIHSLIYKLESIKYRYFEKRMLKRYHNWITCSPVDTNYLRMDKSAKIFTIANPIDTRYFRPMKSKTSQDTLLFRGLMDKPVNVSALLFFLREVYPLVKKRIKNIKLIIAGPHPTASIIKYHNNKDIFVTDYVKDIRSVMKKASVTICPIHVGTGTRQKILQSWAMGIPIVSTKVGAEGLPAIHNKNILLSDTPEGLSRSIIQLLTQKGLRSRLAKNGLAEVRKSYSLQIVARELEKVLRYATAQKNSR